MADAGCRSQTPISGRNASRFAEKPTERFSQLVASTGSIQGRGAATQKRKSPNDVAQVISHSHGTSLAAPAAKPKFSRDKLEAPIQWLLWRKARVAMAAMGATSQPAAEVRSSTFQASCRNGAVPIDVPGSCQSLPGATRHHAVVRGGPLIEGIHRNNVRDRLGRTSAMEGRRQAMLIAR